MNRLSRWLIWLTQSSLFIYSISVCLISYIIRISVHAIKDIFNIPDIQFRERLINDKFDITVDFIIDALVIAPILETWLFQTLFFWIYKKSKVKKEIIVLVSGLAFGLWHNYSIFYIIDTALIGCFFMYFYILRAEANNKPFYSTFAAHILINIMAVTAMLITRFFMNNVIIIVSANFLN